MRFTTARAALTPANGITRAAFFAYFIIMQADTISRAEGITPMMRLTPSADITNSHIAEKR